MFVNVLHQFGRQFDRVATEFSIESLVTINHTVNFLYLVTTTEFVGKRANDIIEPRAEPTARHDRCFGDGRIEKDFSPSAGRFQTETVRRPSRLICEIADTVFSIKNAVRFFDIIDRVLSIVQQRHQWGIKVALA